MEDQRRKYLDENREKPLDSPGNSSGPEHFQSNDTTGSGLSEAERAFQDGTTNEMDAANDGDTEKLVDHYNINDKAHSDSSPEHFIPTTSNYHHADDPQDSPENDSRH